MTADYYRVMLGTNTVCKENWPEYFENFWRYCIETAEDNNWLAITVANRHLRPLGGRLVQTRTHGWYLRWLDEKSHAFFVLRWS